MAIDPQHTMINPSAVRGRFDAQVEWNRPVCREHFALRIRVNGGFPATRPGQFVQLGCRPPDAAFSGDLLQGRELDWQPGSRPAVAQCELITPLAMLRRPFSLAGRGDERDGTWLEVVHRVVGAGTDWLAHLQPGAAVDLIGPLGNAFELPDDKCLALLVGGGVGLPPMFYLAQALRKAGWDALTFVGATTRDLLAVHFLDGIEPDPTGIPKICVKEFADFDYPTVLTTDDGSYGLHGKITHGLNQILEWLPAESARQAVVFTCGPEPMMHAVAKLAAAKGVACQVCLEQAMACGMGTCQSCVVKIDPRPYGQEPHGLTDAGRPWRYRLACTDGPVFDAKVVVW